MDGYVGIAVAKGMGVAVVAREAVLRYIQHELRISFSK
jgi:hypothetical protein